MSTVYGQERSSSKLRELQDAWSPISKKSWGAFCQCLAPEVRAVTVLCCYLLISNTELGKISHVEKQTKQSKDTAHAGSLKWAANEKTTHKVELCPRGLCSQQQSLGKLAAA